MERPSQSESERRRMIRKRILAMRSGEMGQCTPGRVLPVPPIVRAPPQPPANEVKLALAALAVKLNIRLRLADMPGPIQERAWRRTRALLDANEEKRPNPSRLAMCLKKEFDAMYGPAWHCIVGKSFGSFVTHASGGFVYYSADRLSFLIFKTVVRPVVKPPPLQKLNINA